MFASARIEIDAIDAEDGRPASRVNFEPYLAIEPAKLRDALPYLLAIQLTTVGDQP